MKIDQARQLSADVLLYLAQDPDRLMAFVSSSGVTPADLRRQIDDPATALAVLDFLVQDDAQILDCAGALGLRPQDIMVARTALAGPGSHGWSVD